MQKTKKDKLRENHIRVLKYLWRELIAEQEKVERLKCDVKKMLLGFGIKVK